MGTGREHQMAEVERTPRVEHDTTVLPIDRRHPVMDELDALIDVEGLRPEEHRSGVDLAKKVGLRQGRPLVRQTGFVVHEHDAAPETLLAQSNRHLHAPVSRPHDHH